MADPEGPPRVRHYTVQRNQHGALICDCPQYRATAKTCPDIAAARYYMEFGPPTKYNMAEQGSDERGPQTKGKGKVPPRKSTGKKGQKLNIPTDAGVDDTHEKLLDLLDGDEEWIRNPFATQESRLAAEGKKTGSGSKGSVGRPAAAKPLHTGRSSSSPTKFSGKRGPKGHGFNSLLPPPPPSSPQKLGSDTTPMDEIKKPFLKLAPLSHAIREDLDLVDIDFGRWKSKSYTLRLDEVMVAVDLLNAMCLATRNGILVYGPSYAQDARILQRIVWSQSDEEPILADGTVSGPPLFPRCNRP
ncbi:hypothetical protein B0H16DRAFT_1834871 [Mycena metata]|uniref:SWIM-type domain-containing protein n=1 Tax=Mycena metata TaxID=1033252 RepID=A0AAD7DWG2_9AGAR|nr:hypothetical protein B0H16DRAFT_1834871 [Mycena metata]